MIEFRLHEIKTILLENVYILTWLREINDKKNI